MDNEIKLARANGVLDKLYGQKVNELVRKRYTESEELAILRHKLNGDETEWEEYNAFVEGCKAQAKAELE